MNNEQEDVNIETEELRDILIAISVVAKRLATKIENRKLQVSTSMRVVAKDSLSRSNILLSMTFEGF